MLNFHLHSDHSSNAFTAEMVEEHFNYGAESVFAIENESVRLKKSTSYSNLLP